MAISINGITVAGIGKDGKDATVNGVNALTIEATGGLTGQQSGDTYTISGDGLSGKRTCRFVIGTSTSGWTEDDCDYLCDGTDDQVEINTAIQALPSSGGEIIILDGTYNITATIAMNKNNVKLSGNGNATVLKRMWDSTTGEGVIAITATNGGCCVEDIFIDGNKSAYSSILNSGISLSSNSNNNTITGNTYNNNYYCGIYLSSSNDNTITGNTCNNNHYGIYMSNSSNNTITSNTCNNNNNNNGIYMSNSSNNTITGNTCNNNNSGIYVESSSNNTITGNTYNNNNNNGIYLSNSNNNNTITGNTCNNNSNYGISLANSSNNTITGNTCNNNNNCGIYLSNSNNNNTITGNTCIRREGTSSDYTDSQYTIRLYATNNNYNLISNNNIMGKDVVSNGGTGNSIYSNKWTATTDIEDTIASIGNINTLLDTINGEVI